MSLLESFVLLTCFLMLFSAAIHWSARRRHANGSNNFRRALEENERLASMIDTLQLHLAALHSEIAALNAQNVQLRNELFEISSNIQSLNLHYPTRK